MLNLMKAKSKSFIKRKPAWLRKKYVSPAAARAEYLKKMMELCGSIDDETFVRPPQAMI